MLRDPRPRSAHRANPGSGLAILSRPALTRTHVPAQHRRTPVRPQDETTRRLRPRTATTWGTPRRPTGPLHPLAQPQQALQLLLSGLGALIITSIVVLTGFFVVAEESRGPIDGSAARTDLSAQSIRSRAVDTEPLTRREVFPGTEIRPAAGAEPYRVAVTHVDTDCATAATGELGAVLDEHGCSQVVRAGLIAPYGDYRVTAGVFNVADADAAAAVSEETGLLVEAGRGSFAVLSTGGTVAAPLAQVGWHTAGHYVLYCAISRPDGSLVTDDDPYAEQITEDVVEHYLTQDVIARRSINP
ncbi:hypothetical protein Asp14428_38240 [Actinoplanes sp. NBRC 14428]|nr:hypothetical protein Asp14428_38240 [Actinoplanes sp. NBRC 14428]